MTEEQCLRLAQGAYGCHAETQEMRYHCRRLEGQGLVYRGPYPNLRGHAVYFGVQRSWALIGGKAR